MNTNPRQVVIEAILELRVFTRVTLKRLVVGAAGLLLDAAECMLKLNHWLIRVLG